MSLRFSFCLALAAVSLPLCGCDQWHQYVEEQFGLKWARDAEGNIRLATVPPGDRLTRMISSENPDERREAVVSLCTPERSMPDNVVQLLATMVRQDPDPTVRAAAARALGVSPNPAATEPLIEACGDDNAFVRLDAVRGLAGKHDDNAKRALLVRLARDGDPQVRSAAAAGLHVYHERRVLDSLVNALRDPDFAVVYMAEQSLMRMTGHSCDYDPDAWSRWLAGHGQSGDPFALAGQTPPKLQQANQPLSQRIGDAMRRAWFWWQAEEKPQ